MEHALSGEEGRQLFKQVISIALRKQVVKMMGINELFEQPQKCFLRKLPGRNADCKYLLTAPSLSKRCDTYVYIF